jgi:ankyrin repeat protein
VAPRLIFSRLIGICILCTTSYFASGNQPYACKQNGKIIYQPFPCNNTLELSPAIKQHTKEKDLIVFSKQGNEALVYKFLTEGVSPNATDEQGNSALFYALQQQFYSMARLLIASKANTNHLLASRENLIMFFANSGDYQALQLLLASNGNINYAEPIHGNTALLTATMANKVKTVKFLLSSNANANLANHAGITPLIAALENKNATLVDLLLQNKANINQLSKPKYKDLSMTPLIHFATNGDQENIIKLLKLGANVNLSNEKKISPLTAAALVGHLNIVKLLLAVGADPSTLYQNPQLWEYIKTKSNPKIAELIEDKINIKLTDSINHKK